MKPQSQKEMYETDLEPNHSSQPSLAVPGPPGPRAKDKLSELLHFICRSHGATLLQSPFKKELAVEGQECG